MGAAPRTGTGRRKPVRTDSLTSWNGMPRLMSITPEKKEILTSGNIAGFER